MKKNPLHLLILILILMITISCGRNNNHNEATSGVNDEFMLAYKNASLSPIVQTKCFGGFCLGMSPQQIDSVFKIWVNEYKIVKSDEAGTGYASIIDTTYIEPKIDSYAYTYEVGLSYTLDIQFYPSYLDNRLVSLFCSVKTPEKNMNPKEVYKFLADEFEKSERGKNFKKFNLEIDGFENICFIKDNLEISFFPQPDLAESSISYRNIPLMEQFYKQEKAKTDPARDL